MTNKGSRFHRYVLPGIVFQSVLIGGAYATGREIVEYGAKFGAAGVWSILALGTGFTVISALAYEFARVTRRYDYRTLVRELVGPLWPLFDALYVVMVIVVIAVVSAASGNVFVDVLGVSYWVGVGFVIALVAAINAAGRQTIERFKTIGSALLYAGYVVFAGLVLSQTWGNVERTFATGDTSYYLPGGVATGAIPLSTLLFTGILYAGYNLAGLPSVLFVLDRQTERREALWAGVITGLLSTIPFTLTYLAVLGFYPDPEVLGANVPWLVMLRRVGGGGLVAFYAGVILWTLVETSVGMIHAIIDRISVNRIEGGGTALTSTQSAAITVGFLVATAILSQLGLIALVAQGYTAMAYGFLALFALPLLTVGVRRILSTKRAAR